MHTFKSDLLKSSAFSSSVSVLQLKDASLVLVVLESFKSHSMARLCETDLSQNKSYEKQMCLFNISFQIFFAH